MRYPPPSATTGAQTRSGRVVYGERYELVRQALTLLTRLGAHPEITETSPVDVRSALMMVWGALQWCTRPR
jgi:hypothetical protein